MNCNARASTKLQGIKNCFGTNRSAFPVVSTGKGAEGKTRGLSQKQPREWKYNLMADNRNPPKGW